MAKITDAVPRKPNESLPMYRSRIRDIRLRAKRARMLDRWSHKREGTPETHEHASRQRQGPLARLCQQGYIDADQLAWAMEIAAVAESIERDVAVKCSSYEMRVDHQGSAKDVLAEGVHWVRMQVAYSWWRDRIPQPRRAVLDMLVGEPASYSTIARTYRMGKKRARKILIAAIDLWPQAVDTAELEVDRDSLNSALARLGELHDYDPDRSRRENSR